MTTHVTSRVNLLNAVEAAVRAPSIHNTQPWLFQLTGDAVDVYADRTRQLSIADPDGTAMRVSCGAAILHLRLAIAHQGWSTQTVLLPNPHEPDLLARVSVQGRQRATPVEEELYAAIARRHSNRRPFLDTAVPLDVRARLVEAAHAEGAWLDVIVGPAAQEMIAELVRAADRILLRDDAYRAELAAWVRDDDHGVDGVPRQSGGPAPEPTDLLARRDFGGPARPPGREYEADPLIAVLGSHGGTRRDDLHAGQALERVLLTATGNGLVTSLISQPIDVPQVREQLRIGLRRPGPPQMLLRGGYGVAGYSPPRRPIADVLLPGESSPP